MEGDPGYSALRLARIDVHLRLFQAHVAEHGRAIARVAADLAEAERPSRRPARRRRFGEVPDAAQPCIAFYLWLAVVAAWMVTAREVLLLPR